ncbi:MAG TPA: thiamine phosphate synthase [Rhizomicrobium sp.]|jgi:thiamine-phosphate pyrophosphorylase|nr:thiamine phosphate synthase [Rhizomicrobium sp.]
MNAALARQALRLNVAMPLVLMTDERKADWICAAKALPRGSVVIIRARDAASRTNLLRQLRPIPYLRLLVADDPRLAMEAEGLHLPEAHLRQAPHWRAKHPGWIITAAAHSLGALLAAREVDAVFLSPVFASASHPRARALTPVRAALIAAAATRKKIPVYALGGMEARNAALLARSFSGIAAVSSLLCAR